MSQICPSSSHQLAAAALAFHRAKRKFSNPTEVKSQSELLSKNNEGSCKGMIATTETGMTGTTTTTTTRTLDKKENTSSKLRVSRDCCCLRNCKSAGDEHSFDEDKSNQHLDVVDTVGDSIVVGVSKMKNVTDNVDAVEKIIKNNIYEFQDPAEYDGFDIKPKSMKGSGSKKSSVINHEKISNHCEQLYNNRESIDLLYKTDTLNDDRALDFSSKLHEWECRTRDGSLMKIQRFSPSKLSKFKQDSQRQQKQKHQQQQEQQLQNINNHDHLNSSTCQTKCHHHHHRRHYCDHHQNKSVKSSDAEFILQNKSHCRHKKKFEKFHDHREGPQALCRRCNMIRCPINLKMIDTLAEDVDETEDEELVKGTGGLIKHKDSLDILVDKFKNRKILGEPKSKGKKVIGSWMKIDESLSCEKIPDQLTLDEATKESSCTDHRASKTCWTHTESLQHRSNKLYDRFKRRDCTSQFD